VPIDEGQDRVLQCYLANLAYRTGGRQECDPVARRMVRNPEAIRLWERK
jgi:hypothetical protein